MENSVDRKFAVSLIVLCLFMTQVSIAEDEITENNQTETKVELDKGKSIFKRKKKQKPIKVKPEKIKAQYKVTDKVKHVYSLPLDVYMPVGDETDKSMKLEGAVSKAVVLNLADCLELALINNPRIKAAYAKSAIAKYQKWETLSGYTPYLDWTTSANRMKPDLTMLRGASTLPSSAYNKYILGQIGIRQLVWDFGYTQNKYTINKIEYERSKTEIDSTVNDVVCQVKDAYYNLIYAFDRKQVALDNLESYTNTYYQALAFWEVGTTTKVDVLFAQTNMEEAKAQLISAENGIDIAFSKLNNAMGLPFVAKYMIDTLVNFEPITISMREAIEIANNSRPDLKGAMLSVDEANQGVKLAWKTFLPKIELQANWATGGVNKWSDKDWYNFGGVLSFPTVNPVLIRNQIKEANAQYEQMQYEVKSQLNDIYLDIQTVYTNLKDAKARIPVSYTAMQRAQENYDLTCGRYKVGYGNIIELKDAQSVLSDAKLNYYKTIHEYNSAKANLERAIGQTVKPDSQKTNETQEL